MTSELKLKIEELIQDAENENAQSVVVVLHTMIGCSLMGTDKEFAVYVQDFSRKMLAHIHDYKSKQN